MRSWLNGKRPIALALVIFTLHVLPAGCASRVVPGQFPTDAAASTAAPEAPSVAAGNALAEEPPLPGQPTIQWPGLRGDEAAKQPSKHGDHHGH